MRTIILIRRGLVLAIVVAVMLALLVAGQQGASRAYALTYSGPMIIDCVGIDGLATTLDLDRDNTGIGEESARIEVHDGAGTLLLLFVNQLPLGTYTLGSSLYATAPAFNPITFRFYSEAGNGLSEVLAYEQSGACPGLPTAAPALMVPNEGTILIGWSQMQHAYVAPGGDVARDSAGNEISLPADDDGNGFDTYTVTGVKVVDGRTWVSIFLGSGNWGWVPLDSVTPITDLPEPEE